MARRRPEERYRIYRVRWGKLKCVAATAKEEHVFPTILDQQNPESGADFATNRCHRRPRRWGWG